MKKNIHWYGISLILLFIMILVVYKTWPKVDESSHQPVCKNPCKLNEACMNTSFLGHLLIVQCFPIPKKAPLQNIQLPFKRHTQVFCTHASAVGTHSWPNAYWALDLASSYEKENATIHAALGGIAYISQEHCQEPRGTSTSAETSACGLGFGNWVKIYHEQGYYSFYAHLDRILVKNGERIKQGQPIGIEGWTGNAGHRHLHWSMQKLPGKTEKEWLQQISIFMGDSVPFDFWALDHHHMLRKFSTGDLDCAHSNITSTSQAKFNDTENRVGK